MSNNDHLFQTDDVSDLPKHAQHQLARCTYPKSKPKAKALGKKATMPRPLVDEVLDAFIDSSEENLSVNEIVAYLARAKNLTPWRYNIHNALYRLRDAGTIDQLDTQTYRLNKFGGNHGY
jgi:hypothetical protein